MKKKIILIDDDIFKKVLQAILMQMGYEVLLANEGSEGLDLMDEHGSEVALILLDMLMPGMDGLRFLTLLRKKGFDTKVMAMSSVNDPEVIEKVKALGVEDYCVKPLGAETIKSKITEILGA